MHALHYLLYIHAYIHILMRNSCNHPFAFADSTDRPTEPWLLRLIGGRGPNEGRLEIYIKFVCDTSAFHSGFLSNEYLLSGRWSTVCDRFAQWVLYPANTETVCRQLGYSTDRSYSGAHLGHAYYGEGNGPIVMDNFRCIGYEQHLQDCLHVDENTTSSPCSHSDDVGVACSK